MKLVFKIWWASLLIKLVLSAILPMSADEAYYWIWSKNLQLSYFDHPPAIAWLIYLGSFLEPFGQAVRWPVVFVGHLTYLVWIFILNRFYTINEKQLVLWSSIFLLSPLLGFGSLIATPDVPLLLFFSLGIYFFLSALKFNRKIDYALLGVSLGAGFCSKYHIVLLPVIFLIYLIFTKSLFKISKKGLFLVFIFGLLFSMPVIYWNFQNDFISFRFQLNHGLGKSVWKPSWTADYLLGQILLLIPISFIYFSDYKNSVLRKKENIFLIIGFLFPLLFFLATSFRGHVEANWPIMSQLFLFALCAQMDPNKIKRSVWGHGLAWSFLFLLVFSQMIRPWSEQLPEKISEPHFYKNLAPLVKEYQPLYADTYQLSSSLSYYSKTPVLKLFEMSRRDYFDFLQNSRPPTNFFYLIRNKETSYPDWLLQGNYDYKQVLNINTNYELLRVDKQ